MVLLVFCGSGFLQFGFADLLSQSSRGCAVFFLAVLLIFGVLYSGQ